MRKWILVVLAVSFMAMPVKAQEYPALVYTVGGEEINCSFVRQDGFTVVLRIEGVQRQYSPNDLAVVIFDNNYTNYYTDQQALESANPNMAFLKQGHVLIPGRVLSVVPQGITQIELPTRGVARYNTVEIARIYYNPRPFFDKATITGNNTVEFAADENKGDDDSKKGNRKDRKKKEKKVESLVGGQVFIKMKGGATTRGIVYDVTGTDPQLVLTDGRKLMLRDISLINYVEVKDNYPKDKRSIKVGGATFIMRNGAVTYGQVIDYRGDGEWELADGRMLPWGQIARIYF